MLKSGGLGIVYYAGLGISGSNFKLLKLVNMNTGPESPGIPLLKNGQDIRDIQDQELKQLLGEYQDVFSKEVPEGLPPKRAVDHEINTTSKSYAGESPVECHAGESQVEMLSQVEVLLNTKQNVAIQSTLELKAYL